jgi:hypothetical protein
VLKNLDVSSPFRLRVKFAKFGGFSSEVLAEEPYCGVRLVGCPPKEPGG